jgi:hypothetical protein
MFKFRKILLSVFAITILISCNKTDYNYPEGTVAGSRITNFPLLSIKGERLMTVKVGDAYTEPGVDATEGGATIPYTTDGAVNTAVPAVYTLTYSAVNKDGFSASVFRTVVVYSTDASAAANDLSGDYARSTNGSIASWTKIAPGVYTVFNPGGAPGTNVTIIAINPTGFTIKIPVQPIGEGGTPITSSDEVYTNSDPPKYTWKIVNSGYGTALRTFTKI